MAGPEKVCPMVGVVRTHKRPVRQRCAGRAAWLRENESGGGAEVLVRPGRSRAVSPGPLNSFYGVAHARHQRCPDLHHALAQRREPHPSEILPRREPLRRRRLEHQPQKLTLIIDRPGLERRLPECCLVQDDVDHRPLTSTSSCPTYQGRQACNLGVLRLDRGRDHRDRLGIGVTAQDALGQRPRKPYPLSDQLGTLVFGIAQPSRIARR